MLIFARLLAKKISGRLLVVCVASCWRKVGIRNEDCCSSVTSTCPCSALPDSEQPWTFLACTPRGLVAVDNLRALLPLKSWGSCCHGPPGACCQGCTPSVCCYGDIRSLSCDPRNLLSWWPLGLIAMVTLEAPVILTTETPLSWQVEHGFFALSHRMNWQIGWDCLKDFAFSHHRKTIAMRLHVFERAFGSTVIYGLFCCNNSHKEQQGNVLILYRDICNALSLFLTYLYPYAMR